MERKGLLSRSLSSDASVGNGAGDLNSQHEWESVPPAVEPEPFVVEQPPHPVAETIEIEAFTVAANPTLDCARAWVDCPHGPGCPYRARVGRLFRSELDARKAVPYYMLEQIGHAFEYRDGPRIVARRMQRKAEFPSYHVLSIKGSFQGRDYHKHHCHLDDPYRQLAWGDAGQSAWRTVRHNKDHHRIDGALLPIQFSDLLEEVPQTAFGSIFLFASAAQSIEVRSCGMVKGFIPD